MKRLLLIVLLCTSCKHSSPLMDRRNVDHYIAEMAHKTAKAGGTLQEAHAMVDAAKWHKGCTYTNEFKQTN